MLSSIRDMKMQSGGVAPPSLRHAGLILVEAGDDGAAIDVRVVAAPLGAVLVDPGLVTEIGLVRHDCWV